MQGGFTEAGDQQALRLDFSQAAGELAPGQDSGEIKIRFNRADWSPFKQDGNFSFSPLTDYTLWDRVTLYVDGKRVWGIEPGSSPSPTIQAETSKTGSSATLMPTATTQTTPTTPQVENSPTTGPVAALVPTTPAGDSDVQGPSSLMLFLGGMLTAFGISLLAIQIFRRLRFSHADKEAGKSDR